jgi:hypothetical protein
MLPQSSSSFGGEAVAARSAATPLVLDESTAAEEIVVGDDLPVDELRESIDEDVPPAATDFWHPPVDYPWGKWQARVGAILLNRSRPSDQNLNGVVPPFRDSDFGTQNAPYANASDFAFPLSAGVDVALRRPSEVVDLDFRYFGVNQSTADWGPYSGSSVYILARPFFNSQTPSSSDSILVSYPQFAFEPDWAVAAQLNSSLQSAELNLRRAVTPNVALLCGFRYLQFREVLLSREQIDLSSAPVNIAYDLRGQNELFGFQVGNELSVARIGNRLWIDLFAKMGVFGNVASSKFSTAASLSQGSGYFDDWAAHRNVTSFALEAGASIGVQLTRRLALRGGYQLLNLTNVATVGGQMQALYEPGFQTFADDNVLFHGATAGLEWGW